MHLRRAPSHSVFIAVLVIGVLARVAVFPSRGTPDLGAFVVWMYHAVAQGPTQVYGVGGWPPERPVMTFDGLEAGVDYPPGAIYALAAAGHLYVAGLGEFRDSAALIVAIKVLTTSASIALAFLIWFVVGRRAGAGPARLATIAYWVNPAVILHSAALGYIGVLAVLPAVAALLAANAGYAWISGALFAAAALTKPQALLTLPAILLVLVRAAPGARQLAAAFAGAATVSMAALLPIVLAGASPNLAWALGGLVTDGWLSAQAANVWWLVGYAIAVAEHAVENGMAAVLVEAELIHLSSLVDLPGAVAGRSTGLLVGIVVTWIGVGAVVAWAAWRAARRHDMLTSVAFAAFTVHTYFVLAVQVHENHLFLALPLLTIVAAERPAYRGLLAVVSAIVALNLNMFYGFGGSVGFALPRSVTLIDATVLLAIANLVTYMWHARLFLQQTADGDDGAGTLAYSRSKIPAAPMPPPTHMVTIP